MGGVGVDRASQGVGRLACPRTTALEGGTMIRRLSVLVMICVLALSGVAGIAPAAAQAGVTVNIRAIDAQTGESILSACFVLVDFSNIGCDENADGLIRYEGVPAGDYLVDQVQPAAGYVTVHDIPITVKASPAT